MTKPLILLPLFAFMAQAANYSAQKISLEGFDAVRLTDAAHKTEVTIVPSLGNNTFSFTVNGKDVLWSPHKKLSQAHDSPALHGIPLLAPWANRLDADFFWANDKKFHLNPDLGNLRYDQYHQPIHGLVTFTDKWQVVSVHADAGAAQVTSRLEFWKYPEWMAQFPFAHTLEMTHRLAGGVLEVRLAITNLSAASMPVAIGFHPYYQITDAPRDEWRVHLAAHTHYKLSDKLIPTGETKASELPNVMPLAGHVLDDVFGGIADGDEFWVQGKSEKIAVRYGPKYKIAVVYAPQGRGSFICFEPMAAITDAVNLAHAGVYRDLQTIAAGGKWEESFWIKPSGY